MSKIKMRCITCGKWFQSANAKEVTCPDCMQKARKEKLATKNTPPVSNRPAGIPGAASNTPPRPPAPPKPKPVQSGTSHWLDKLEDVKIGQPDQPPPRPKPQTPPVPRDNRSGQGGYRTPNTGPGNNPYQRDGGYRGPGAYREDFRGPGAYRVSGNTGYSGTLGQRPRQPMESGHGRGGPRPDRPRHSGPREGGPHGGPRPQRPKTRSAGPRPASPPKPKREKTPPPQPFTPTIEQITQVEERYLQLAVPAEFDGIRTQIAQELTIPKKAVKRIIKELRDRQNIPSWWELQTYKGSQEELERIKAAYEPLLPIPPIGVHKKIADELALKPGTVYQAIKTIRLEMNLPQYNDPGLHGEELVRQQRTNGQKAQAAETPAETEATTAAEIEPGQPPSPSAEEVESIASVTSTTETTGEGGE